jgi:hypothetical protein
MTAVDTLVPGMNATHDVLRHRLSKAARARPDRPHPRDHYRAIDTFLASASRHNAALLEVLVPAVRERLPVGEARADEFVHQVKQLEVELAQVKAKLYGSTYAIRRGWRSIWKDVRREFDATWRLERALIKELARHRQDGDPDWGERIYHAELHAPTRPHPFVPHRGLRGWIARRVALRVDRFWDATEGRMIPEPVHPHDRDHDGRLTQYLLADPHVPEEQVPEEDVPDE